MTSDDGWTASVDRRWRQVRGVAFGDRVGLVIFLASCCLFGLFWRTSFLINDNYTLANGLYALERGSLAMDTAAYGPALDTPGANFFDGETYARNYGVIALALPVLLVLRGLSVVADLRIALVAAWCLLVLATILVAGGVLDRRRAARRWGSVAVLGLFAVNVALARPLDPVPYHLVALQVVHVVAAAFVGVFVYRLATEASDRRRGLAAAALVVLGTPLAFWASVPKRHVVTGAVVVGVAFALARSRDGDRRHATTARALAYGLVGFLAWVHAAEALVLFAALVVVDLPTAPANDRRTLAVVGGVFLVSLLPMALTNVAITGHPLKVPRSLRSVSAAADISLAGGSSSGGGGGGTTSAGVGRYVPGFVLVGFALFQSAVEPVARLQGLLWDGARTVYDHPERVYDVLVRSGYADRVARRANDAPATNLSLLESAPVLAGLLAVLPSVRRMPPFASDVNRRRRRVAPADWFVAVAAVGYTLVFVSRLPIHAQVTVRYLFPLYPLAVYGLVRLSPVGTVLTDHWRTFCWTYAAAVLVGGQFLLVALVWLAPGRGEAFQFHALVSLATAGLTAAWALTGRTDGWWGRAGSAAIALATAAATTFLVFTTLEYFALGDSHALPMMRALADLVTLP